jgi:hypothetical protein
MTKYGDFDKKADNVLGTDVYKYDTTLKVKTKVSGVAVDASGDLKSQKITAKYSPFDGFNITKFSAGTSGKVVCEANMDKVMDGMKFAFAGEGTSAGEMKKADIKIDYKGSGFVSNTKVSPLKSTVTESLSFNYESFWFGGSGTFSEAGLSKYDVGLNYAEKDFAASLIAAPGKSGDWDLACSYFQSVNADTSVAALLNLNAFATDGRSTDITVGATHKMDATNTVSSKIGFDGSKSGDLPLSFAYSTKLTDAIAMDAGAEVNALNFGPDSGKFGLGITVSV